MSILEHEMGLETLTLRSQEPTKDKLIKHTYVGLIKLLIHNKKWTLGEQESS